MPSIELISTLSMVAGVLGVIAIVAYFYFLLVSRLHHKSLENMIEGEGIANSPQVTKVLERFENDESRLDALKEILNHDEKKAAAILRKVKGNVDLNRLSTASSRDRRHILLSAGFIFLAICVLSAAYDLSSNSPAVIQDHDDLRRLQSEISPRRLSDENAQKFVSELKGKITPICIISYGGAESEGFANSIYQPLASAGLIGVNEDGNIAHRISSGLRNDIQGVWVITPASSDLEARNDPLIAALKRANVTVSGWVWMDVQGGAHFGFESAIGPFPAVSTTTGKIVLPNSPTILKSGERVLMIGEKPLSSR